MNYEERIDENFLKGDHVDGEVLHHTDLNELEDVVKTAINANYLDIQMMQDGSKPVSGATSVQANEGVAYLSQLSEETLQATDSKFPSSAQVKSYVDNLYNSANVGLIYYWDGTNTQENVNLFNTLCGKYDANIPFVLFGRFSVEFEFVDEYDVPYTEYKQVVAPIIVNKMVEKEEEGTTYFSFVSPPIMYWGIYAIGSVKLVGEWGEFTAIQAASWSPTDVAPVSYGQFSTAIEDLQDQLDALVNGDEVEF